MLRAEIVGRLLLQLDREGWKPDRVLAHCGWGEALPVKDIWPHTSLIVWPELWIRPEHMAMGLVLSIFKRRENFNYLILVEILLPRHLLQGHVLGFCLHFIMRIAFRMNIMAIECI